MTTFKDALRSNAAQGQTANERHTCAACGAIDLAVSEQRPICPPCHRRLRASMGPQDGG